MSGRLGISNFIMIDWTFMIGIITNANLAHAFLIENLLHFRSERLIDRHYRIFKLGYKNFITNLYISKIINYQ